MTPTCRRYLGRTRYSATYNPATGNVDLTIVSGQGQEKLFFVPYALITGLVETVELTRRAEELQQQLHQAREGYRGQ